MYSQLYWASRRLVANIRVMPNTFLIGVQKGGTTSLYEYLVQHPSILKGYKKAPKFFDHNYYRGILWYRAHYPSIFRYFSNGELNRDLICLDASQDMIYHPLSAGRIATHIKNPKFIVMFRNPVDRAYSHYKHRQRVKAENLTFEDAIASEPERLGDIRKRLIDGDENIPLYNFLNYSYLARGLYAQQMEIWFNQFPRSNFLFLKSENFFENPRTGYLKVLEFLNLPLWEPDEFPNSNPGKYSTMKPETRAKLIEYFRPYNQSFYELMEEDYKWDE